MTATSGRAGEAAEPCDGSRAGPRGKSSRAWFVVKLALGGAIVGWLAASGRLDPEVFAALGDRAPFLALVVAAQASAAALQIFRWWVLARALELPIGLGEAFRASIVGCGANIVAPGGLGLEGARLVHFRRGMLGRIPELVSTFALDRVLGLLALLVLAFASVIALGGTVLGESARTLQVIGAALVVAGVAALFVLTGASPLVAPTWLRTRRAWRETAGALARYRRRAPALAVGLLVSIASHVFNAIAAWGALIALGVAGELLGVLAATPLVVLAKALPIVPAGLGIAEGVAAELYPALGLAAGAEAQILLRATYTVLFGTGALAMIACRARSAGADAHRRSGPTPSHGAVARRDPQEKSLVET